MTHEIVLSPFVIGLCSAAKYMLLSNLDSNARPDAIPIN